MFAVVVHGVLQTPKGCLFGLRMKFVKLTQKPAQEEYLHVYDAATFREETDLSQELGCVSQEI